MTLTAYVLWKYLDSPQNGYLFLEILFHVLAQGKFMYSGYTNQINRGVHLQLLLRNKELPNQKVALALVDSLVQKLEAHKHLNRSQIWTTVIK